MVSSFWLFWVASDNSPKEQTVFISRVVDGDTVELEDATQIRLLGINTPEKGMYFYGEAKNFTENLIKNKSLSFKFFEEDKYSRKLGYLFLEKQNVNELIVKEGFAHLYYYEEDEYYSEIKNAETSAREKELGIWKHSKHYGCLNLTSFIYLDITEKDKEKLVLKNNCDVSLDVAIKDDATHIYKEKIPASGIFEKETQSIWNDDGDSVYIWDLDGLVFFYRYP